MSHFHPNLIFSNKLELKLLKLLKGLLSKYRFLTLPTNIRLGWMGLPATTAVYYYGTELITVVKSFMVQAPENSLEQNSQNFLLVNVLF